MPAEDDISIEEKRVYAGSAGRTDVYVAAGMGLVRVAVSGDKIGEFGVVERAAATDVAILAREGAPDRIALATETGLLVGDLPIEDGSRGRVDAGIEFGETPLGPTVAVGTHDGAFVAAGADGAVTRLERDCGPGNGNGTDGTAETGDVGDGTAEIGDAGGASDPVAVRLGEVAEPTAVDGPLVAAADGVYRIVGDGLQNVGLAGVADVAGRGVPLAATGDGLYWLGNGWMDALAGGFRAVAADGKGHSIAAGRSDGLHVHAGDEWGADSWEAASLPVPAPVAAVAYGSGIALAVTEAGALCVDAGDGWRYQVIGVTDVGGITAVPAE